MFRSRARLCSLRPRAEEYGPWPISAGFFDILFVFIFLFSEGFLALFFTDFAGIFFPHGVFSFAGIFSNF
jgi:hypothetical protein